MATENNVWVCIWCTLENKDINHYVCEVCGKSDAKQYKKITGENLRPIGN